MNKGNITNVVAHEHTYDAGSCTICGAADPDYVAPEAPETPNYNTLATFEFGENGDASHSDGSEITASNAETVGTYSNNDYILTLENYSKVYANARDAQGNSCLKLGTSKAVATFSFTVADDVKQVVIKVAGYKANTAKINVNGVDYTVTSQSSNGDYTEIVVDTSVNKTVEFATVSGGVRAMINSIAFMG